MSVTITINGDHPVTFAGYELSGYHRALSGETASLTVACAPDAVWSEWLATPPLGAQCSVEYDGEQVMDGFVYTVKADANKVEIGVEG